MLQIMTTVEAVLGAYLKDFLPGKTILAVNLNYAEFASDMILLQSLLDKYCDGNTSLAKQHYDWLFVDMPMKTATIMEAKLQNTGLPVYIFTDGKCVKSPNKTVS